MGGTQELGHGTRLPGAQGQGIREALSVGGEVVSLSQAHSGPHNGVDVLGDHVEELGEVGDEDVHHSVLKPGEVQLHVHCADHFLEGHPSAGAVGSPWRDTPWQARSGHPAPQEPRLAHSGG